MTAVAMVVPPIEVVVVPTWPDVAAIVEPTPAMQPLPLRVRQPIVPVEELAGLAVWRPPDLPLIP